MSEGTETNVYKTAQEERLERLFATWHHLVKSLEAGHNVHQELDEVIRAVFTEISINPGVGTYGK